tara:strand:- start:193 stop:1089 length:897 start_codon:yes stop_codon:yes gene_type:complete
MPGPHQDNGVPWTISTPTTTPKTPVSTGTPNFGPPGTGGSNQPPPPPPPEVNFGLGDPHGGDREYTPIYPGLGEKGGTEYTMEDVMGDLALTHGSLTNPDGTPTKYGLSYAGKTGQLGSDHTLGSFIAVDSSGNPILDSQGNPVYTSLGKHIHDEMQDAGWVGPNQKILGPDMPALQDFVQGLSYEDIHGMEDDFWRDYTAPGGEGGYEDYGNLLDDRRAWQEQLWYGPRQSPQKDIQEQGFFDTMEAAYQPDIEETLKKGLYSKTFMHPGAGILPWGMEKKWATGRAKGGIVSLVGE